jgi:hypothetical protein
MIRTKVGHGPEHKFTIPLRHGKKLEVWFSFGKNPKVRFSLFFISQWRDDESFIYKVYHFDIGWKDSPYA